MSVVSRWSPQTKNASLHLKMDGWNWNTIVSFWDGLFFRGDFGYFREGSPAENQDDCLENQP